MFSTDHFPELGSDLIAALATLDVKDFTHFLRGGAFESGRSGDLKLKLKVKKKAIGGENGDERFYRGSKGFKNILFNELGRIYGH